MPLNSDNHLTCNIMNQMEKIEENGRNDVKSKNRGDMSRFHQKEQEMHDRNEFLMNFN